MEQQLSELLRPTELADLIQPLEIIRGLERMLEQRFMVNMLFYGQPGLGKTSAARILIEKFEADVYKVNGSMSIGVDSVRTNLEGYCTTFSLFSGIKICFIDECEFLSTNAQAAMRGVIEKAADHVRFLLTANDISKLQPALKSRCMPVSFNVGPLDAENVIARLLPRYTDKLARLGYAVDRDWLNDAMHINFPDLRSLANKIEFKYGPPSGTALFHLEREGEAGKQKAA